MKWIVSSLAVVLMIFWLVGGRQAGIVPAGDLSSVPPLTRLEVPEKAASPAKAFSWGMPEKKAFLMDGKRAGQLPLEDSAWSAEEIMEKSREDGVYAYRAWLLYYRCDKYIPLAKDLQDDAEVMTLDTCRLYVEKLSDNHNEILYLAAKSGLPNAQIDYAIHGFEAYTEEDFADKSSKKMKVAKEAFSMVEDAALKGSVDAMLLTSSAYEIGTVVEKNPVNAYAFEYAAHKTGLVKNRDRLLALMEEDMTKNQVHEAIQRGNAILQKCCME